jgi:hypothetical protein
MLGRDGSDDCAGAPMTSFDWSVLTAGLAVGVGVSFIAAAARRRRTTRLVDVAQTDPGSRRRRIDVVALDECTKTTDQP